MYTRKQFFLMGVKQCFDCAEALYSSSFADNPGPLNSCRDESLYMEAMKRGIDPGTLSREDLIQKLKLLRAEEENSGNGSIEVEPGK